MMLRTFMAQSASSTNRALQVPSSHSFNGAATTWSRMGRAGARLDPPRWRSFNVVARVDASAAFADEVKQEVRGELLVATNGRPAGLSRYSGAGELAAYVRVVATRAALRLLNRRKEPVRHALPSTPGRDPELDYLKVRYGTEFERAFRNALASLSTRDRLLLKRHSVDCVGSLASIYRLHRSNAARRLAQASSSEVESLLTLVRSQMWISLRGALQQP